MKKMNVFFMAILFMIALYPLQIMAEGKTETAAVNTVESLEMAEAELIMNRLNEIEDMDKSEMSASEKKDMRKEVRDLKSDLKNLADGVYLSVGALILVVVLLILLL
jgi:predicted PurR-regulated permease PerM